jgi:hypothetical protein
MRLSCKKGEQLKKYIFTALCGASLLYGNSEVSLTTGKKDYSNSMTNVDGKTLNLNLSHKYENGKITLGYLKDDVERVHSVTKANLPDLRVKKYNAEYKHFINQKLDLKASYIKISDNLAPTDQGKVYGLGAGYKLPKDFGLNVDYYRSDYKPFDVNQYDAAFYKGFKADELKGKVTIGTKVIKIDGDKYNPAAAFTFPDKSYNTQFVKLGLNYQGYVAGVGAFFGKNIFTVLDDGAKVQHHAREIEKAYMLSLGKKFKNFDIVAKYSLKKSNELPENRYDVDVKVIALSLSYKF